MSAGFFAVLDDISILADDAATMSKVALKKTSSILGDDLAVNAEKASNFHASRELPVLWAITKGSFINKFIILPIMFLLNYFLPELIIPILIVGGLYLAYEGAEKVIHYYHEWKISKEEKIQKLKTELDSNEDETISEQDKIKSAIFTDFILSIEIILIALETVLDKSLPIQIIVVSAIAIAATIGVYGIVALLVRMDDAGYYLIRKSKQNNDSIKTKTTVANGVETITTTEIKVNNKFLYSLGNILISSMCKIIKSLGYIGTVAMLMVAGGIFSHKIETIHHWIEKSNLNVLVAEISIALIAGLIIYFIIEISKKLYSKI